MERQNSNKKVVSSVLIGALIGGGMAFAQCKLLKKDNYAARKGAIMGAGLGAFIGLGVHWINSGGRVGRQASKKVEPEKQK